jgi:MFS family permease
MYLPTAVAFAVAIFSAGYVTSAIGYYTPIMAIGSALLAVGAGLMSTFEVDSPKAEWIGYQILYGIGAGLAFQQTYTAVQTVLPEKYVPTALVCLSFTQELGGVVALSVAQNVFLNLTISRFLGIVPGLQRQTIVEQGTVSLPSSIPAEYQPAIYQAYNQTIVDVLYIGLATSILTICSLCIEWKSVRNEKKEETDDRSDGSEVEA